MAAILTMTPDEMLTTTRTVRKRLDLDRAVPREVIKECLELAFQAPNGSNMNTWQWVVVDDPATVRLCAQIYRDGMKDFVAGMGNATGERYAGAQIPGAQAIGESVEHLRQNLDRMPALLFPLIGGRTEGKGLAYQASMWGSVLQAVWSFMLAGRTRGLGSAWTTVHLMREKEMADLLGISCDQYTQVGLFPIAYTKGTDFKPAWRKPASEVVSWNRFGER